VVLEINPFPLPVMQNIKTLFDNLLLAYMTYLFCVCVNLVALKRRVFLILS
jgi:hypothetical protein